ncbi:meiosis-specific protein MEI4 isoform X3 [Dromaius novaehollandiae]|uniref:meiosis-specific protein MEI4 isoform X3 n=1 Tax=Dromaius novaehollandiae TaxID=8790 RepID=UPI00311EA959
MEPGGGPRGGGPAAEIKGRRENQVWYLKISKLALAFAIIHSKPPGKSCKEYTQHLAKIVSEKDFGWKSKVEALEAEVLRLRQELLLNKICPRFCLENGKPGASAEDLLVQECTYPMGYSSQLEDSGCDVSSDYAFDSLGIASDFHQCERNLDTSKYCLEIVPPLNLCCTNKDKPLTASVQFLQHLLEIRKLSEIGILQTDFTKLENDSFTICSSVSQLLDGLTVFYNSPKFPVSDILTEAVCVLVSLIADTKLSNHVLKKCFKKLEEFKKKLIQIILRNSSINRIQAMYDVTQYENIFSLFMILEQLLQNETEESNTSSSEYDREGKNKFLKNLDQIILHLSDEFPLFSLYLWRLSVHYQLIQSNTSEFTVAQHSTEVHVIIGELDWKRHQEVSSQEDSTLPAQSRGSCGVRPGCSVTYPVLKTSKDRDCTTSLGNLFHCLTVFIVKKFLQLYLI